MPRHMTPRNPRSRRIAALLSAAGIAMVAYGLVSTRGDGGDGRDAARAPATSAPTVLGAVVTPEDRLPDAPPASPVSLAVDDAGDDVEGPATTRPAAPPAPPPTAAPPTTAPAPTTSTEPPPTLVPPTVIENTTTTSPPSTTTTEGEPAAEAP